MKLLLFLLLFPLGLIAQDSGTIKTRIRKIPTWDETTCWQHRISAGYAILYPEQFARAPFGAQRYGDFKAHNGWTLSNSLIRNYRRIPVSLVADLGIVNNQVYMTLYDTLSGFWMNSYGRVQVNRIYKFRNLSLVDLGIGAEIEGQYIFADFQYRIGYLWGGKTDDTGKSQPEIVRNKRLHLNSNIFHGLHLGLGLRYKKFHVRGNFTIPLSGNHQVQMYKDWECPIVFLSLTAGYTWSI